MSAQLEMRQKLDWLRADYASFGDGPFNHFYCPILHKDEDAELCLGHVINEAIANSSRARIPQRKDIDGFYGSLSESGFSTAIKANRPTINDILFNADLRRRIPLSISIEGKPIDYYEDRGNAAANHPALRIEGKDGQCLNLALKISDEQLGDTSKLHFEINRDYVPEATASLLKAAHLTMFALLGYRHVFSPGGQMVAEILRTFFEQNLNKLRTEQIDAARAYFPNHAGMVLPLHSFDSNLVRGSIEDRRFLICVGSSTRWYALGVFVRTDSLMHVVFLPPDEPESMDTYFALIKDMHRKEFRYRLIDFCTGNDTIGAHWKGYAKDFVFDAGPADAA